MRPAEQTLKIRVFPRKARVRIPVKTVYQLGSQNLGEYVEPLGKRILLRKDESRQRTRGGIVLPDQAEIPTITGRVVEISAQIERDSDFPIRKYDKVLFHPKNAIPVDLEPNNVLYVVPIEDVVAVFRRTDSPRMKKTTDEDETEFLETDDF